MAMRIAGREVGMGRPGAAIALGGGASELGRAYYESLALSRVGLAPSGDRGYGFLWEDFDRAQGPGTTGTWQQALTVTGTISTRVAGAKGGVIRCASGAGANSSADLQSNNSLIAAIGSDRWWLGARLAIVTAVTAQTIIGVGLYDNVNKSVELGVFGAGSAANFCLQYDGSFAGTFANTGVAIDTAMHVFELYSKGDGKLYYRVDLTTTEASITPAAPSALSQFLYLMTTNGTDAVNRSVDRDFVACLYPR